MESKVKSDLNINIIKPTAQEFNNFYDFVEQKREFALKVIPPMECVFKSNILDDKQRLDCVVTQSVKKLESKLINISFDKKCKMTYGEFKEEAKKLKIPINSTVEQIEDLSWDRLKAKKKMRTPKYAIDNDFSLFNDAASWDLRKFTYKQSIIHSVSFEIF